MKTTLVTVMLMLAFAASAQSIDTTTVQLSPDYLDFDEVKLQIAAQQYDSIMYGDLKEYPFGIVLQNGKGGVYDFRNAGLVTVLLVGLTRQLPSPWLFRKSVRTSRPKWKNR